MELTQPLPFREALLRVDISHIVPSTLSHAELSGIVSDIRERTFTAARVANAEALQRLRDTIRQVVSGEITESAARGKLLDVGLPPSRINLIVETQVGMARGYGQWRQSQAAIKSYPALEFFRAEERQEPRDWPERWAKAGGSFYPGESDYPEGRMIAPINDPIWEQISAFGQPYPPFDFNSGMWTRRVSMKEALELGVLESEDDLPEAEDRDFDDDEQYDAGALDDDLRDALLDSLGAKYRFNKEGVLEAVPNPLANSEFHEEQHPRDNDGKFAVKGEPRTKPRLTDEQVVRIKGQMMQAAYNKLGLDKVKGLSFLLVGEQKTDVVDGEECEFMGDYNPATGQIRIYPAAFESQEILEGVLAHEVTHHRWQQARASTPAQPGKMNQDVQDLLDRHVLKLTKSDGVTAYSKLYWKEYMRVGGTDALDLAINETLAELTRLKTERDPRFGKAAAVWKRLHKTLMEVTTNA